MNWQGQTDVQSQKEIISWSKAEMQICRRFYPNYAILEAKLPGRSRSAIRVQCRRLGLSTSKHQWTSEDISRLRQLFPNTSWQKLLEEFPFATMKMIQNMAQRHGLRRMIEQNQKYAGNKSG